jgi:hypothetical protein
MGIVLSITFFLLSPLLIISQRHSLLFALSIFAVISDIILKVGAFPLFLVAYIFLWYLLLNPRQVINICSGILSFLWLELFIIVGVGIIFLIFPWDDPAEAYRTSTQRLPLRTLIGIIRTLEMYMLVFYFYFVIRRYDIKLNTIIQAIVVTLCINLVIGYIDHIYTGGIIRTIIRPEHSALERFTGLQGEPRSIAQVSISCCLFLVPFLKVSAGQNKKIILIGILSSIIMIALSFSTSGIGYLCICVLIYFIVGRVRVKYILLSILGMTFFGLLLLTSQEFVERQSMKIARLNLEEEENLIEEVPNFINLFESFDQSALSFYYFNPQYTILGVGPNTMSIPSSKYMSIIALKSFEGAQNNSPVNGVVYILSRSGLVGLMLYIVSFWLLLKRLRKKHKVYFEILLISIAYYCMYRSNTFFCILGIVMALYKSDALTQSNTSIEVKNIK